MFKNYISLSNSGSTMLNNTVKSGVSSSRNKVGASQKLWLLVVMMFLSMLTGQQAFAQPSNLEGEVAAGTWNNTNTLTDIGAFRQVRIQAAWSGTANYLFNSAPSNYNPQWTGSNAPDFARSVNTIYAGGYYYTSGGWNSNHQTAVTSGKYYTFNIEESAAANNRMQVLETTFNPTTISTVTQSPLAAAVTKGSPVTVTVTMAATPNASEFVYVRYTTNSYATSSLALVTFTGAVGTATIPASSSAVSYYVMSSNLSAATISTNYDLSTLSLNNNAGANYNYTPSNVVVVSGASGATINSYATLSAAVTAINAMTSPLTNPVVCYVSSDFTETAPAAGYSITVTGTATNTLKFLKSGSGVNPILTAFSPQVAGQKYDAVFKIIGGDYITLDGFTLKENAANTTSAIATNTMTEFGVALFAASATDGAQNNTIQNNTITMSSATAYQNAIGVFSTTASSATNAAQAASSIAGTNSNNKFYSNTISGVAQGFYFISPAQTATVFESGNDIGGTSLATGNTITYGITNTAGDLGFTSYSGTTPAGVFFRNVVGNSVRYNTITSQSGLTLTSGGIFSANGTAPSGVTYTSNFSNNIITITNASTTAITGIEFGSGLATGTLIASNNTIVLNQNPAAANSAAVKGINAAYASASNTANSNNITINQTTTGTGATSGALTAISVAGASTTINALTNTVLVNQTTASTAAVTSAVNGIVATGVATTLNIGSSGNGNTITVKQAVTGSGSYGAGAITYIDMSAGHGTANALYNTLNTTGSTIRSTGAVIGVKCEGTVTVGYFVTNNTATIDKVASGGSITFTSQTTGPSNVADTVSNNIITYTNLAGTSTATGISQLGGPSASGVKVFDSNTINISGTNTGTTKGIAWGYSGGARISNNSITINNAAPTLIAIDGSSTSAGGNGGIYNNTISLTSSTTSPTSMIGINATVAASPYQIYSNIFSAMNFTGIITGSPVVSAIVVAAGTGNNVYSNTITNIAVGAATSTATPTIDGILISGGVSTNVYKNKIYGISTLTTGATGVVDGIRISGGGTATPFNAVYNNLIGGLTATAASNPDAIRGINITSTTASSTNNVYFNTIGISGAGGTNFGGSGIFHTTSTTATTAILNLRNNIISNTITPSGTGTAVAFRRSSGIASTLANYASTSNNNILYVTSGANNYLYHDGTSNAQTIAAYKAGAFTAGTIAPRDSSSNSENPPFLSTTGSASTFLHINTATASLIESGGAAISGFTDDYDADTRNVTTPDIGADEFTGTPAAVVAINSVAISPTGSACTAASRTITANTTAGAGAITSVTLNYSFNGTAQTPITMTGGTTTAGSTSNWTATIPVASPTNAVVAWSVTAVDAIASKNTAGTGYQDAPLTGYSASAAATVSPVCAGSPTVLSATITTAGSVALGSGASTSSSLGGTMFPGSWGGAKTQYLFTAAELTALGLSAGNITSLAFEATSSGQAYPGFAMSIGTTANSVMSTSNGLLSGLTQVYTNASYTPTVGVNTLTFSTPFNWNGTSNIVVSFCWSTALTTSTSSTVKTDTASFNSSYGWQVDSQSAATICGTTGVPSGGNTVVVGTTRPKFTFAGVIGLTPTAYSWSDGSTVVGATNNLSVSPTTNTTYTPTLTYAGCTIAATGVAVVATALPARPNGTGSTQCGTGIPTASVSSGNSFATPTYRWYAASTGGTALQTGTSTTYLASISTTTHFYVSEASSPTTCEGPRLDILATVNTPDAISATPSVTSVCLGDSVTLTGANTASSPTQSYTYTWLSTANSGAATVQSGNGISVTPTAAGTYTYTATATDGGCITTATTATVTVNALPTISSATASASTVCAGTPITITALTPTIATGNITLGAGGTTSSSVADTFFPGAWGGAKTQYIIKASELTGLNLSAGAINSLGFVAVSVGQAYQGFTVQMGATSATVLTSTFLNTAMTQVYKGTLTNDGFLPVVGTNTLAFGTGTGSSSSFTWDGSSNIVVSICWSSVPSASTSTATSLKVDGAGFVCAAYDRTDSVTPAVECSTTVGDGTGSNRPQFIINGQILTIGAGSLTWSWTDGSGSVGTSSNVLSITPAATTTYTVRGTNAATTCYATANVPITVNALPTLPTDATAVYTQCGTAVPAATVSDPNGFSAPVYRWYSASTAGTLLQTGGTTYTTAISATTTFYVSVADTSVSCESARRAITITVTSPTAILVTPGATSSLCLGATLTLGSSNPSAYPTNSWTVSPETGSGMSGTLSGISQTLTPTATGTYVYTVSGTDGVCTDTKTVTVTVHALPIITSTTASATTTCAGDAITLNTSSTVIGTGPTGLPGTYCAATNSGVSTISAVSFNGLSTSGVQTTPYYTLYAPATTTTTLTAGNTYSFSMNTDATSTASIASVWIDFNRNGVYEASEWQQVWTNGFSGTISILVPLTATLGDTGMRVRSRSTGNPNASTDACSSMASGSTQDFTVTIQGAVDNSGLYTYSWSNGTSNFATGTSTTAAPTATTTYTVTATEIAASGCTNTGNVVVTVLPLPTLPTDATTVYTQCGLGVPTAIVSDPNGFSAPVYRWYSASTGGTLLQTGGTSYATVINATTTFYVSVADTVSSCESARRAITITVTAPNALVASTTLSAISCLGTATSLSVAQTGATNTYALTWTASPATGSGIPTSVGGSLTTPNSITPTAAGTYTYTVTGVDSTLGCTTSATTSVTVSDPLFGITATASTTAATVCAGNPTVLNAVLTSAGGSLTIGSGATSSSSTGASFFPGSWGGAKTQYLIKASELTALGLSAGPISSLAFEPSTSGQTYTGFSLSIGATSQTTTTTTFVSTGLSQVYLGTLTNDGYTPTAGAVNTLAFGTGSGSSSSFTWDGTSNIILSFSWSSVPNATTAVSSTMAVDAPGFSCSTYNQADSTAPATMLAATTGTVASSRPKFTFVGVTAVTPTSYSWSDGTSVVGTTNALSQSPTTSTTYTATLGYGGCSLTSNSVAVTVNALPTQPTALASTQCGAGTPTCSVTTGGTGIGTYKWYTVSTGGTAISGQTGSSLAAYSIAVPTHFYVSENGSNGCESARTDVFADVTSPPTISISAPTTTVCTNSAFSPTATSATGYTYTWTCPTTGNGITGTVTGASPTITPTIAGSYTYTVSGTGGGSLGNCATTQTVVVTALALPIIASVTATSPTICEGSSTGLTALTATIAAGNVTMGTGALTSSGSGGSSVNYASPFSHWFGGLKAQYLVKASELTAAGLSAGALTSLAFDVTTAGTAYTGYTINVGTTAATALTSTFVTGLTQVYTEGISGTTTPTVGINTYAFGTGSGSASSLTWNGTDNVVVEISWSNNNGGGTAAEVKYDTTSYVSLSQYHTDNVTVATVSGTTTASGTASLRPKMIFGGQTSTAGAGTLTWSWSTGATGNTTTVSPTTTTTYTATGSNGTCSNTGTVTVTVNPKPALLVATAAHQCGAGISTAHVADSNNSFTTPTIKWYTVATGGVAVQSSTSTTLTSSVSTTSSYYVSVVNPTTGCESDRVQVDITVDSMPSASISYAGTPFCSSATTGTGVTLTAATGTGSATGTYSSTSGLDINATTGAISPTTSTVGTYTVTYTMDGGGCGTVAPYTSVTINAAPTSGFTYSASNYCTSGITTSPTITGTAGTFTATPAGLNINATTGVINLSASSAGTYAITNTVSVAGCANSATTVSGLVITTGPAIGTQPSGASIIPGDNTSFTVAASGTGITYQWYALSTAPGATWTAVTNGTDSNGTVVSGATSATLSLNTVSIDWNDYQYRVDVIGTSPCGTITSNPVLLTVKTISFTAQPASQTVCNTSGVTFSVATTTSTATITYQWEVKYVGTLSFVTISGATADSYNIPSGLTSANTGELYHCLVYLDSGSGPVLTLTSNNATLTVNDTLAITADPANQTLCTTATTSAPFGATVTGTNLTYQWEYRTSTLGTWTTIGGATSSTYTVSSPTYAMNGYQYHVIVTNPCNTATSGPATLTMKQAVAITTNLSTTAQMICPATTASFTIAATGDGLTYQWYKSISGTPTLLTNGATGSGATISGATSNSLSISTPVEFNNYSFYCVVSGDASCSSVTSASQPLKVISGGTYSIGPDAVDTFATITSAITFIKNCTITSPVVLELDTNYSYTSETYPIALNAIPGSSATNTITIRIKSGVSNKIITSAAATATFNFDGGSNYIIDGQTGGSGSTKNLTISNSNVGGIAIQYVNDAINNVVKYTNINGVNTSATSGVVVFGGSTATLGNDGNTIDNCTIADGATTPTNMVYAAGQSGTITNDNNTISNSAISNYFNTTAIAAGISINANNSAWTVTGNKFFQTATRTGATTYQKAIFVNNTGTSYTINNNTIGYSNASGTGMTTYAAGSAARFTGIEVSVGATPITTMQGNTINNINFATTSAASTLGAAAFNGIIVNAGGVTTGTGNTIGASSGVGTTTNGIYVVSSTTGAGIYPIYVNSATACTVTNNTIGAIAATSATAAIGYTFTGISVAGTGGHTVSSNSVGNTTAASIALGTVGTTTTLSTFKGIESTATGAVTIGSSGAGNTVQNINLNAVATNAFTAIVNSGAATTLNINFNTIKGIVFGATGTAHASTFTGVTSTGNVTTAVSVNNNTLGTSSANLVNYALTATAASGTLTGISVTGTGAATVHNIKNNDFRGIVYAFAGSGAHTYITLTGATAASDVATIDGNTFTNLNVNTIGSVTFIAHSYSIAATGSMTLNNNSIVTAFNKGGAGGTVTIDTTGASSPNGAIYNQTNNNFSNITVTGATGITGFTNFDGSGSSSTKTITGNTFNNWTGGTSAITAMTFGYWGGTSTSFSNNTITNITGQSSITGVSLGSTANLATLLTVSGNTITGLVSTGTGGSVTGLTCANTSTVININGNTINTLTSTSTPVTAIAVTGATTTNVFSNTINTLSSSNASGVVNGITVSSGSAVNVYGNSINTLLSSGATTPGVNGIAVSGGTTVKVYKNKIYDLLASGAFTTTGAVNGMVFSAGTTVSAFNNLVGDLRATAANSADAIRGISVTSTTATTSYNLYNNTIYLNASSSGAAFGTTGIYHTTSATATTAKLDLQNNIVINASTTGSTSGVATALRRSSAAVLGNFASTSNRNMYFAGTPSTTHTIMYDGTNTYYNFTTGTAGTLFQTAVSTREANSFTDTAFSAATFFAATSGSSSTYLQPNTGIITLAESGGNNLSAVFTDDYNSQTRPVSPGTAYDLGAWEFTGQTTAPVITFSSATPVLTSQCTAAARSIAVNITTAAGTITTTTLNYSFNGTAQTAITTPASIVGSVYTFSIPVATPANATVAWSLTAVNSGLLSTTYTGTSYSDAPLTGATATAAATLSTVCSGSPTVLSATLTKAGTATIGTGTSLTSATTQPTAFCNRWPSYRMQTVYTAAELQASGLRAGNITSMAFNVTSLGDAATNSGFVVMIGNTASTVLSGSFVSTASGFTTVYPSQTYTHTATGLQTIPFSTPFAWDGTSNIIVDMIQSGANATNNSITYYTDTAAVGNTVAYTTTASSNAASFSTQRLNVTFAGTTAQSISNYSWATSAVPGAEIGTGNNLSVSPTATTSYVATITSSGCTSTTSAVAITVNPTSVGGTVASDQAICTGTTPASLTLTGNTGTVTKWQKSLTTDFASATDIAGTSTTLTGATIGTLTATTYFRAVVQSGTGIGACATANSAYATVTVNPTTVGGTVAGNQAVCSGSQPSTDLTLSSNTGDVVKWQKSLNTSFTSPTDITSTSTTLSGATIGNLSATTYFRAVVQSGACASVNSTNYVTVTVNTTVAGTVSGGAATCSGSTSGLLTVADYTGSIVRWESSVSPFTTWNTIANTTSTYTSGALTETTQFRAVVNNNSCGEANATPTTVTIESTTWTVTGSVGSWSNGTPSSVKAAIIAGNYTSAGAGAGDLTACSLTVNAGYTVIVTTGDDFNISGAVNVDATSTLTFNNNADLLQGTTATANTNSGSITSKRNASMRRLEYVYWSAPVANQNLLAFSPLTLANRFYTFDEPTNAFVAVASPSTTTFGTSESQIAGKGFMIRAPNTFLDAPAAPQAFSGSFTGVPNNGTYTTPVSNSGTNHGYNLIGNPYPSPIDADLFLAGNPGTLYFWTHATLGSGANNYASYTAAGATAAGANGATCNGTIQTGQGFLILTTTNGNATFTNAMRLGNNTGQFFKTATTEKHRIWLNLNSATTTFNQIMVGYIEGATQGVDTSIDGSLLPYGSSSLSSRIDNADYVIQGRALPFATADTVPLGFNAAAAGEFTISIDHVDGLFLGSQDIYLRDNLLGTTYNIKASPYTFTSASGAFNNRFEIVYTSSPLGTHNPTFDADSVVVYKQDQVLNVNSGTTVMSKVRVFDVRGRLIFEKNNINATAVKLTDLKAEQQVLLVQITSDDNRIVTKKVVY